MQQADYTPLSTVKFAEPVYVAGQARVFQPLAYGVYQIRGAVQSPISAKVSV